jgi:hypothetical protein
MPTIFISHPSSRVDLCLSRHQYPRANPSAKPRSLLDNRYVHIRSEVYVADTKLETVVVVATDNRLPTIDIRFGASVAWLKSDFISMGARWCSRTNSVAVGAATVRRAGTARVALAWA